VYLAPPLGLIKAPNARDLGGYRTADGREVRRGLLYRSDSLQRLTDEDLGRLGDLGLGCLIDFRSPDEIVAIGADRLPEPPPARVLALPLHDPEHDVFVSVGVLLGRVEAGAELAEHITYDATTVMLTLYRWFVTSAVARAAFGAALRTIADPSALPLLFHCTAGKDRTGWLSAILLSALGVDRATVFADYLRTNDLNAPGFDQLLERIAERVSDPTLAIPLLEARAEYLEAAFAEVTRVYGTLDAYLHDGLALPESTLPTLRTALLS
jgi:protein-tyrosine phosphatase